MFVKGPHRRHSAKLAVNGDSPFARGEWRTVTLVAAWVSGVSLAKEPPLPTVGLPPLAVTSR